MNPMQSAGRRLMILAQDLVLYIVGLATLILIGEEVWTMIDNRAVELADILLLFIYLEVLAMVTLYLESGKLPVRMPLYITIVALARYLILDMKEMDNLRMLIVASAALILALTVLVIRYGHLKFPYSRGDG
ncbi:phosphate-starvation-inducible protein PsiE [Gallaecimonas sp. GXIMD1310]|uniref:phosphate-starvation-inducible protein PsiE n=1 Tax=Gallaecimonas sp. GXIMD1310 TaxID=3131926 RepID=UPI003243C604